MARLKDVPTLCSLTLLEQPFKCYIAPNLSGPFQTVFCCSRVGEIHTFSRFFKNQFFCVSKVTNYYLKIINNLRAYVCVV